MDAMELLMHGRTTLMIAHRLSTLEHCNARLSLEEGRAITMAGGSGFGASAVTVGLRAPGA